MADPILTQRAVLEALERKIDTLGAVNELSDGITLQLYFWNDLAKEYPDIFRSTTPEDVLLSIANLEKESGGRFKLMAIKPSTATNQNILGANVGIMRENGRTLDITNLYWDIRYSERANNQEPKITSKVFWLRDKSAIFIIWSSLCSMRSLALTLAKSSSVAKGLVT